MTPRLRALTAALLLALPSAASAKGSLKRWIGELDGPDTPRQAAAARALGRSQDKEALAPLLAHLDVKRYSPRFSQAVVEALGMLEDERALDGLLRAWDYMHSLEMQLGEELPANMQALRGAIVESISKIGTERAVALLEEAVTSKDPYVVQKAAEGIGRLQDVRGVPILVQLLPRGGALSQTAFEALGQIKDPRAKTPLQAYLKGEDVTAQVQAAYALSMRDRGYHLYLVNVLKNDRQDAADRVLAAYYLTRLGQRSGLDYLAELAQKGHPAEKMHAIEALGKTDSQKAVPVLIEALDTADTTTKTYLTQALARLGGPKALSALRALDEDKNPTVKRAAREALLDLGEEL